MNLPFTSEQFLRVFTDYNTAIFPLQIVFNLVAILLVVLTFREKVPVRFISTVIAVLWLWMGLAYHFMFFASINKAAIIFGSLKIIEALMIFYFGMIKSKISFRFERNIFNYLGLILILYGLLVYPIIGYFNNHIYPASPTFGLPCPTTIFTFGMLLIINKRLPLIILLIPFIWSVIGFTAAFKLGITEDIGLLISGILASTIVILRNRKMSKK